MPFPIDRVIGIDPLGVLDQRQDLLGVLGGKDRHGDGILMMNFFAGIETSAATLCWAITCLGADSRVQDRVHDEVVRHDESHPYLDCFLNETMRYFPAVPFVIREVASAATLGNIELRAGSLVLLSVVGVHHHRDYWKEPHIFDTARAEFLENTYDRRAFIPFLTGPRMCGGARLARLELTEGLKAFVRLFSVERRSEEFSFDYGLAMRPSSSMEIEICRRH
jgi:cytochrome P450